MITPSTPSRPITLEREGSLLHAWLFGIGEGPFVVLIHGATMDHRMFNDQLEPLVSAGYRVMTLDQRGHGLSKPLGLDSLSVSDLADDVLALADSIGVEHFIVIGQSLGGYVAQDLVLRHPERIVALGVIGSTCATANISPLAQTFLKQSLSWFRWWPYSHLKKLMVKSLANSTEVKAYAEDAMGMLSKEEFLTVWDAVTRAVTPRPGYRIEHPLLLTHGDQDSTGDVRKAAVPWAQRDPNSTYVVIPQSRHNANQDNPEFFNTILLNFLTEVAPLRNAL